MVKRYNHEFCLFFDLTFLDISEQMKDAKLYEAVLELHRADPVLKSVSLIREAIE